MIHATSLFLVELILALRIAQRARQTTKNKKKWS
jgi:hypothetical protein